jgi:hypothetical protein
VNGRTELFLALIAVATFLIALVQVAVMVAAGLLARRLGRLADQVEQELKPIFASVNAIGRDAARAASLATAQVERADRLFADLAARVEQVAAGFQASLGAPAREGRAFLRAFRAAIQAIRDIRAERARQNRADEEDALFI